MLHISVIGDMISRRPNDGILTRSSRYTWAASLERLSSFVYSSHAYHVVTDTVQWSLYQTVCWTAVGLIIIHK